MNNQLLVLFSVVNTSTDCLFWFTMDIIEIYDSDDRKGIAIAENFKLQNDSDDKTYNIRSSGDDPPNIIGDAKIKQEVDSDSDIEVDLAYRVIDTFDVREGKSFKQEDDNISLDTDTSFKTGLHNDHNQLQLKMESKGM